MVVWTFQFGTRKNGKILKINFVLRRKQKQKNVFLCD